MVQNNRDPGVRTGPFMSSLKMLTHLLAPHYLLLLACLLAYSFNPELVEKYVINIWWDIRHF